jgi:hypothetical protein
MRSCSTLFLMVRAQSGGARSLHEVFTSELAQFMAPPFIHSVISFGRLAAHVGTCGKRSVAGPTATDVPPKWHNKERAFGDATGGRCSRSTTRGIKLASSARATRGQVLRYTAAPDREVSVSHRPFTIRSALTNRRRSSIGTKDGSIIAIIQGTMPRRRTTSVRASASTPSRSSAVGHRHLAHRRHGRKSYGRQRCADSEEQR